MNDLLNAQQRRSVTATLAHVERGMRTVEEVLAGPVDALFFTLRTELSDEQQAAIRERLAALRECLREAVEQFDLPVERRDGRRVARAALVSAWEGLEDAHAKKLARYGPVDPALEAALDPLIERLIALTFAVLRALENQPRDG